jgi:phospholipid/cholesterol/gamma-HCH transport system permease protein
MPASSEPLSARASARPAGETLEVTVSGQWQVTDRRPAWTDLIGQQSPARIGLRTEDLGAWDTSLIVFLFEIVEWAAARKIAVDPAALPPQIQALLSQLAASHQQSVPRERAESLTALVGSLTLQVWAGARAIFQFFGECVLGLGRLLRRPGKFRWGDCIDQMQQCGAMALPIVSLISFLVGLTMAYQAAIELRQFGADIYVADLVGESVVREMGPMMVAVVLAGRTGAAFAATLGNMKTNEEIDALEVLGISAVDFLVLPRLIALAIMMPLLALYADFVGMLGGMVVSAGILQIPPTAYWIETQSIVDLTDINSGLIKATAFGLLVGLSGCLRGMQSERSAAGVGKATTSAVVTAILLIIVGDALFAVLFNFLGI